MSTEVRWRCGNINKEKLFSLSVAIKEGRNIVCLSIGCGRGGSLCRGTEDSQARCAGNGKRICFCCSVFENVKKCYESNRDGRVGEGGVCW